MSKKDELLSQKEEPKFELFDLNDQEKGQLQALAELVQQARLAQDVIYTNLLQSIATRHQLNNRTIDIDMAEVFKNGAANAQLRARKVEDEPTEEPSEETTEENEEVK